MKKVLHVGCGKKSITDMPLGFQDGSWHEVRFDINEDLKPDIVGTITDMVSVENSSMDALFSSHNLEHVFPHEVIGVLKEFRRTIIDDGFVVVTCPDIQEVCRHVAEGGGRLIKPLFDSPVGPVRPIDILYGHIASVAKGEIHMAHKTGFDLHTLAASFKAAGFSLYTGYRDLKTYELWMIGFKNPIDPEKGKQIMRAYCGKPNSRSGNYSPHISPGNP